jgi:4-carboxymuconolactone decarboxylase
MMTVSDRADVTIVQADADAKLLIRLAAVIAVGSEGAIRNELQQCHASANPVQIEEVILQSHLFCGFPRALNSAREWRRISGRPAPEEDESQVSTDTWRQRGEEMCARVYGESYGQLRKNVRLLHPGLDEWMVVEGYGRVLSRPQLQIKTRELCIIAACAASRQERQLHSHLHGALNVGASEQEIEAALDCIGGLVDAASLGRSRSLWHKVRQVRRQ